MSNMPESFKIYKEKVTVSVNGKDEIYELFPLSGVHYGKFMNVLKAMPKDENDTDIIGKFSEDDVKVIHMLLMHMFKDSYNLTSPDDIRNLDLTISKNLFAFLPVLLQVNLPNVEEKV